MSIIKVVKLLYQISQAILCRQPSITRTRLKGGGGKKDFRATSYRVSSIQLQHPIQGGHTYKKKRSARLLQDTGNIIPQVCSEPEGLGEKKILTKLMEGVLSQALKEMLTLEVRFLPMKKSLTLGGL